MKLNWDLKPHEERQQQVDGKYLIITKTAGPIEIIAGGSIPVEMDINERLHLHGISPQDRNIKIRNITGANNQVEIITSDLLIDKRTSADLANALVSIADGERIGIDPNQNIVQAIIQNAISLNPDGNAIKIEDAQCVGIDPNKNHVTANISNAIKIDPLHNTIQIEPIVKPLTQYQSLDMIALTEDGTMPVIEGNALREKLILTTDKDNLGTVWVSQSENTGIPLYSNQRIELNITEALSITGSPGDKLYAAETVVLPQ